MNKLSNKEVILILVVINIALYYLLYAIGINPVKHNISANSSEIKTLQTDYDEKKAIVDSEQDYINKIDELTTAKAELFKNGFPNTNAENIHAFMQKETTAKSVSTQSITINQAPRIAAAEGGEVETGIMDNNITLNVEGSYTNVISLLAEIENQQKTSLLTSLNLSGSKDAVTASMGYSFLSADKTDIEDHIFDHEFSQAAGNQALFK